MEKVPCQGKKEEDMIQIKRFWKVGGISKKKKKKIGGVYVGERMRSAGGRGEREEEQRDRVVVKLNDCSVRIIIDDSGAVNY